MRWVCLLVVACACGRIGFDPTGASTPSDGHAGSASDARTGGGSDASSVAPCDPTACAAVNGSCQNNVCVISCGLTCTMARCPTNGACEIDVTGAAQGGVSCGMASACTVKCTGLGACMGGVTCTSPVCSISCTGTTSCQTGVTCGPGACTIDCATFGVCQGGIHCQTACSCNASGNVNSPPSCPPSCTQGQSCSTSAPGCQPTC